MARFRNQVLIVGAAAALGLGAAGVYAGTLTADTGTSKVGAGNVELQASCLTKATVTPAPARWNATSKDFVFTMVRVHMTDGDCVGQFVTVNIHEKATGTVITESNPVEVTQVKQDDKKFDVLLNTAVKASINSADYEYGLIFQSEL